MNRLLLLSATFAGISFGAYATPISPPLVKIEAPIKVEVAPKIDVDIGFGATISTSVRNSNENSNSQTAKLNSNSVSNSEQEQRQSQNVLNSGNSSVSARTGDVSGNQSDQSVVVGGDTYNQPKPAASTAYAAPAMIGGGVCAYTPASIGLSARIVGFSGSGSKIDKGCDGRATADAFARLGYNGMACSILLDNDSRFREIARARNFVCPVDRPEISPAVLLVAPSPPRPVIILPSPKSVESDGERG